MQNLQYLFLGCLQITRAASQCLKRKTKQHEKEGRRLSAIIDVVIYFAIGSRRLVKFGFAVQRIENKLAVFVDEAGNSIDEVQP